MDGCGDPHSVERASELINILRHDGLDEPRYAKPLDAAVSCGHRRLMGW